MSLLAAWLLLSGTSVELDPAWQPVADPKALFSAAKVYCSDPNPERRTCAGMTWFSAAPDGSMRHRSVEALSNQHNLAVQSTGRLRWDGDTTCFVLGEESFASAQLVTLAAPHTPVSKQRYQLYFKEERVLPLLDRTICARIYRHRDTGAYLSVGTVDAEFAGELMSSFSFIDVQSGYRLRAAND